MKPYFVSLKGQFYKPTFLMKETYKPQTLIYTNT